MCEVRERDGRKREERLTSLMDNSLEACVCVSPSSLVLSSVREWDGRGWDEQ